MHLEQSPASDRAVREVARGGAANVVASAFSSVASLGLVLVIASTTSTEVAGVLFTVTSVFLIALAAVEMGADQSLVRFLAWYRATDRSDEVWTLTRHVLVVVGAVGGAAATTSAAVLALAPRLGGVDATVSAVLWPFALALPVAAVYEVLLAATRGCGSMRETVVVERVVRPAAQFVAVLAVGLAGGGAGALAVAWTAPYAVGLVATGAAVVGLRRRSGEPSAVGWRGGGSRDFWRYSSARGVARVAQVALARLDIVLVAALAGASSAAVYTVATRFLVAGQVAAQAIQQVLQPWLADLLARGDAAGTQRLFERATVWTVALTWPVYLATAAWASTLLGVFGEEYAEGVWPLVLLSLAMLVATAAGPLDVVLLMAGRSGLSLANMLVALALDVLLCLVLVPAIGILGAAAAWAGAILVRNGLSAWQVRPWLRLSAAPPELGRTIAAAAACFALPALLPVNGLAGAGAVVACSAAAYCALLWRRRTQLGLLALRRRRGAVTAVGVGSGVR